MDASSSLPSDGAAAGPRPPKLLERMRVHLRMRYYSIRTEQAYLDWARRFILYHNKRHPQEMGAREVEAFLSHMAVDGQVAASTQNQAKAAILYLSGRCWPSSCPGSMRWCRRKGRGGCRWCSRPPRCGCC